MARCAARTCARRGDPVGLTARSSASTRRPARASPANPLVGSPDPNARRIIAYGLRNPFRFAFRPGTSELWVGDVGWIDWEEINRIANPTDAPVENFGWPCYEGNPRSPATTRPTSRSARTCTARRALTPARLRLPPRQQGRARRDVPDRQLVGRGLAFEFAPQATSYPAEYQGALFFADYSRDCIWAMKQGRQPHPVTRAHRHLRRRRGEPGQPRVRPGRQPLLRRLRRRHDPPRRAVTATAPARRQLPERSHLDVDDERLGPGREGPSQRRGAAGDGRPADAERHELREGARRPCLLGRRATRSAGTAPASRRRVGVDDEVRAERHRSPSRCSRTRPSLRQRPHDGTTADQGGRRPDRGREPAPARRDERRGQLDTTTATGRSRGSSAERGGDTTPPTITARTPRRAPPGVAVAVSPTATFSEAMNPATLTTSTFTLLKQGRRPRSRRRSRTRARWRRSTRAPTSRRDHLHGDGQGRNRAE